MTSSLQKISRITAKGQTTVPQAVREALGVVAGDQIAYRVQGNDVTLHKMETVESDPALRAFLDMLESDIAGTDVVRLMPDDMISRLDALLGDLDVDLDASIDDEA